MKKLNLLTIAFLFIITILYCKDIILNNDKANNHNCVELQNSITNLINKDILQYKLNNISLKGDSNLLADIVRRSQSSPLVICRFGEFSCETCIDEAMLQLIKNEKSINKDNFLIITHFQDHIRFREILTKYNDQNRFSFQNIEYGQNLYIKDIDEILPPYFFVLESESLIPQKLYIYTKDCPEMNQLYFDLIFHNND